MRLSSILSFSIILLLTACKGEKAAEGTKKDTKETTTNSAKKYTLTPFTESKSFEKAHLAGMSYSNGTFDFTIGEGDYELGTQTEDADSKMCANSAKGQHIHLIVDNAPYAAKYVNKFDYDVKDGEHHILAFLSRSYHESIKDKGASIASKVTVANGSITAAAPMTEPALFYSRPKGTYVGKADTEKVMLDFFPVNVDIGKTHKVIAIINGEEHPITKWQPYYITGLPMGENTIQLALTSMDGSKVNAPMNPVTRTFTLRSDPAE